MIVPAPTCPAHLIRFPGEGHWTYELLDPEGTVLYVGASSSLRVRMRDHRFVFPGEWSAARLTEHPTRQAALAAELALIKQTRPRFNVTGMQR